MSINVVTKIDDSVKIRNVLASVFDKSGLDVLISQLLLINPDIRIFSTGGTFTRLREILKEKAGTCLQQVSDYTGQPETQGGLVKTLDFKIYLGLLTETYNSAHQGDLERTAAVPIDMAIVNLYPFKETAAQADVTVEQARGNIDIGGPCMIRAAAKNFIRVAAVVDPSDYAPIIEKMKTTQGRIPLALRFQLAQKAFKHTADYDRAIADFLGKTPFAAVAKTYPELIS